MQGTDESRQAGVQWRKQEWRGTTVAEGEDPGEYLFEEKKMPGDVSTFRGGRNLKGTKDTM